MYANESKPLTGVDVHVVTKCGAKGVAKYWDEVDKWLSMDKRLPTNSVILKWKYEKAKIETGRRVDEPARIYSSIRTR